jgi:hypothetical protein
MVSLVIQGLLIMELNGSALVRRKNLKAETKVMDAE